MPPSEPGSQIGSAASNARPLSVGALAALPVPAQVASRVPSSKSRSDKAEGAQPALCR